MESIVLGAIQHIGAVCTETFGGCKARRKSQPPEDFCTEAHDVWATLHAAYRGNSVLTATTTLFLATVVISHGAKAPLARFMLWAQKGKQVVRKVLGIANSKGEFCLGSHHFHIMVGTKETRLEHSCPDCWRATLVKGHRHFLQLHSQMSCF